MNLFSPKKLLNSKWTKVKPLNNERHFIVIDIKLDENSEVIECIIEAVISKKSKYIDWIEFKNDKIWIQGWK